VQFIYNPKAKEQIITIDGDEYRHIFKSRRHKKEVNLHLRNLKDTLIYEYKILELDKRSATLELIDSKILDTSPTQNLHIGWCIIDPKDIEKTLPMLNEIGVSQITFIKCQYSQNNFKVNLEKLEKILINSSQQCGRSDIIKLEICDSFEEFLEQNPNSVLLNFSKDNIKKEDKNDTIVIGCEGGFSENELKLASSKEIKTIGINSKNILKSQSAVMSVSAIRLL